MAWHAPMNANERDIYCHKKTQKHTKVVRISGLLFLLLFLRSLRSFAAVLLSFVAWCLCVRTSSSPLVSISGLFLLVEPRMDANARE